MHKSQKFGLMPLALMLAFIVSGCSHDALRSGGVEGRLSIKDTPPRATVDRPPVRAKNSRPDSDLRRFCGERHLRFQARTLHETPDEMQKNNLLCRNLYGPGKQA